MQITEVKYLIILQNIKYIHSRIFKVRNVPTSCVPCLLDKVNQLRTVYNEYLPKDEI